MTFLMKWGIYIPAKPIIDEILIKLRLPNTERSKYQPSAAVYEP